MSFVVSVMEGLLDHMWALLRKSKVRVGGNGVAVCTFSGCRVLNPLAVRSNVTCNSPVIQIHEIVVVRVVWKGRSTHACRSNRQGNGI